MDNFLWNYLGFTFSLQSLYLFSCSNALLTIGNKPKKLEVKGHSRSPSGEGNRFIILSHFEIHRSKRFKLPNLSKEEGVQGSSSPCTSLCRNSSKEVLFPIHIQGTSNPNPPSWLEVSLQGALRCPKIPLALIRT